jgi:hypothetical protein
MGRLGIPAATWAIILISLATALGAYMVLFQNNYFYGIVILWALYGIVLKRKAEPGEANTSIILCGNIALLSF